MRHRRQCMGKNALARRKDFGKTSVNLIAGLVLIGLSCMPCASAVTSYEKGCQYYQLGNYTAARETLIAAVLENPRYWPAYYQLANTYLRSGFLHEAMIHYLTCLELYPTPQARAYCQTAINYIDSRLYNPIAFARDHPEYVKAMSELDAAGKVRLEEERASVAELKADILAAGETEVNRIQGRTKQTIEEMRQNSVWWYYDPFKNDRVPVLSPELEKAVQVEANQQISLVRKDAVERANSMVSPSFDPVAEGLKSQLRARGGSSKIRLNPRFTTINVRNYIIGGRPDSIRYR